jgi:hypothetical protein
MSGANGKVTMSGWEMDITLTMKQQKRIEIIERALRNNLTVVEAAMLLGLSEWQCYRIKGRLRISESRE